MFPEVPFTRAFSFKELGTAALNTNFADFRYFIRSFVDPPKDKKKSIIPKSDIFELARRVSVLQNLLSSDKGLQLLKSWAGKSYSEKTLQNTIDKDVFHICDYVVYPKDGGAYYPNAVMPLRGDIENEACAHSLIADVLGDYAYRVLRSDGLDNGSAKSSTDFVAIACFPSGNDKKDLAYDAAFIADQVRLWLILQAQTQDWNKNLYFLNALRSISEASTSVKNISVLTLSKTEEIPFSQVKAAQNDMKVERVFYRDSLFISGGKSEIRQVPLKKGDVIHRGDRLHAEYRIWSKDNRSFVKVTAPREACLMPVEQLSGRIYGLKSMIIDGWYSFTPSGHRSVKADRTEYYFDVLPEETTVMKEDFNVVQDGVFKAPVLEVECLYAPAYRANDAFRGKLSVERE